MMHSENELNDYNDFEQARVLTVPYDLAGERLDAALAKMLPEFSRNRLSTWIKDGLVFLNGQPAIPKTKLWGSETISVLPQPDPDESAFIAEDIALDIIYEDATLLVLNKAPGLVVHPGTGNWTGTVLNGLLYRYPELKTIPRAGIVHRLDKDTSGLMVIARTLQAQNSLVQQLQARTVKRHYMAVAQGLFGADGKVDAPIGRHPKERIKMAVVHNGKHAVTHYKVHERFTAHTLVECQLETGRTHQIRVHMAHINHPLAADPIYGGKPRLNSPEVSIALSEFARQALHARKLSLIHPESGKTMTWKAALPEDMEMLVKVLRLDAGTDEDEWEDDWDVDDSDCEVMYVRD